MLNYQRVVPFAIFATYSICFWHWPVAFQPTETVWRLDNKIRFNILHEKQLNNCYKGHIIKRHSHRMPRCFYTPPLMVVSFLFLSCMSGHLTKLSPARNTPPVPTEGTDASSRRCRYLVSVWVPLGNQAAPLIPGMGPVWGQNCGNSRKGSIFHQFFTFHSARGHAACMQGSTA